MPKTKKQILFWFSFIFFLPGLAMAESYEIQLSGNRQPLPVQFFVENKTENLSALEGVSLDYHDRNFQLKTSNEIPDTAQFVWAQANEPQSITLSTTSPLKIPVNRTLSNAGQNLRYTIIHPSLFQGKSIKSLQEVNFANKAVKVCFGHFQGNQLSITRPCQAPSSDLVIDETQTDVVIPVFPESVGMNFSVTFGDAPRGVRRVSASIADESSSCESPMSAEELRAAEEYVPLHGDMGKEMEASGYGGMRINYEIQKKGSLQSFRVFVPPGSKSASLNLYCNNDAYTKFAAFRFGRPPKIISAYEQAPHFDYSFNEVGDPLEKIRKKTYYYYNADGLIPIFDTYYVDPMPAENAGWMYVSVLGEGNCYYYKYVASVYPEAFESWYSTLSSWDEVERTQGLWSCQQKSKAGEYAKHPSSSHNETQSGDSQTTPEQPLYDCSGGIAPMLNAFGTNHLRATQKYGAAYTTNKNQTEWRYVDYNNYNQEPCTWTCVPGYTQGTGAQGGDHGVHGCQ